MPCDTLLDNHELLVDLKPIAKQKGNRRPKRPEKYINDTNKPYVTCMAESNSEADEDLWNIGILPNLLNLGEGKLTVTETLKHSQDSEDKHQRDSQDSEDKHQRDSIDFTVETTNTQKERTLSKPSRIPVSVQHQNNFGKEMQMETKKKVTQDQGSTRRTQRHQKQNTNIRKTYPLRSKVQQQNKETPRNQRDNHQSMIPKPRSHETEKQELTLLS